MSLTELAEWYVYQSVADFSEAMEQSTLRMPFLKNNFVLPMRIEPSIWQFWRNDLSHYTTVATTLYYGSFNHYFCNFFNAQTFE